MTVPDRIERLALLCTSSGGAGGSSYPLHELAHLVPAEQAARASMLMDTRSSPQWLAENPAERARLEQLAQARETELTPAALRGAQLQLEARQGHDVFDRLPRIGCPALVAVGRFDGIAPRANGVAIAAQIPAAELCEYEGGHGFFLQDPSALPEIITFLQGR